MVSAGKKSTNAHENSQGYEDEPNKKSQMDYSASLTQLHVLASENILKLLVNIDKPSEPD